MKHGKIIQINLLYTQNFIGMYFIQLLLKLYFTLISIHAKFRNTSSGISIVAALHSKTKPQLKVFFNPNLET